ncbi:MAG: penicillin-binding transpeptidase domain-containing protein [Bacteroidetes bacterium]|nr:penicillin-binding transpeptidase domain-containing protein [Bacteroidota bacterium]
MKKNVILVLLVIFMASHHLLQAQPENDSVKTSFPKSLMNKVTAMKSGTDSALILQGIFNKYGLTGTMLILDPEKNHCFGYNSALWDSGYLPASTFKIANALIALETGVIDTGYVFKWKGEKRKLPQWEHDLTLKNAFKVSCVPCFQEMALKIGPDRMNSYLKKLTYPGMDVHRDNIGLFWLEGKSRITPRQQVEFLQQLYRETLPMEQPAMKAVKAIMVNEVTPGYTLSGKTGWAIRNGNNYGWFVGYVETNGNVYFIATLVEPEDQAEIADFALARKTVTMDVLRFFGLIR